jgi:hypothetical protein
MNFTNKDRITLIKNKEYKNAYIHMVDMGWWSDTDLTSDTDRELFLYRDFFEYYNLLTITGVCGLSEDVYIIINKLKNQLDKELFKVENHIYEVNEED